MQFASLARGQGPAGNLAFDKVVDFGFVSPGPALLSLAEDVLVPVLDEADCCPADNELSILVNAADSALWSDELTVPADTSD